MSVLQFPNSKALNCLRMSAVVDRNCICHWRQHCLGPYHDSHHAWWLSATRFAQREAKNPCDKNEKYWPWFYRGRWRTFVTLRKFKFFGYLSVGSLGTTAVDVYSGMDFLNGNWLGTIHLGAQRVATISTLQGSDYNKRYFGFEAFWKFEVAMGSPPSADSF